MTTELWRWAPNANASFILQTLTRCEEGETELYKAQTRWNLRPDNIMTAWHLNIKG